MASIFPVTHLSWAWVLASLFPATHLFLAPNIKVSMENYQVSLGIVIRAVHSYIAVFAYRFRYWHFCLRHTFFLLLTFRQALR